MKTRLLPYLTAAVMALTMSTVSAAISQVFTSGTNLTKTSPSQSVDLAVEKGDVVVLVATTNKKTSVGQIAFSTTSGDTLATRDTSSLTGKDVNPTQWAAYATISTAGTYTFTATATGDATVNWGAYVLTSDSATEIELVTAQAFETSGLASGSEDVVTSYNWADDRDVLLLEVSGSAFGRFPTPTGLTEQVSNYTPTANSTRTIGDASLTNVSTASFTYSLEWVKNKASMGILGLVFAEKGEDETIGVSEATKNLDYTAQDHTIDITSNATWSWSSDAAWLTSTAPQDQNGDHPFTYSVSENSSGATRTGTITFTTAGGTTATHVITQDANLSLPYINISPVTNTADHTATTASFTITSNVAWKWESNASWLTSSEPTDQNGNQTFTYQVDENPAQAQRTGIITITSPGGVTSTHTVIQNGPPFLTIDPSSQLASATGGDLNFQVDSNTDWSWVASETWVTSSVPTDQNGSLTFVFTLDPNTDTAPRTATITLTYGTNTEVHTITQLGVDPITPPSPLPPLPDITPIAPSTLYANTIYTGIVTSDDASLVYGHLRSLSLQSTGKFTASLYFEKVTYSLSGTFDASGHFTGSFSPTGASPITVDFQLGTTSTSTNNPNIQIQGTVTSGSTTGYLRAIRSSRYTRSSGFYTFLILPDPLDTSAPQGYGYGTVSVPLNTNNPTDVGQTVSISGVLPDGTAWSTSSKISPANELPFFASLYEGEGSIGGLIIFNSETNVGDFSSNIVWHKSETENYQRTMLGSRYLYYSEPNPRAIDLGNTNPNAEFIMGTAATTTNSWAIEWTTQNNVIHHGSDNLNLSVNIHNGSFSGSVPKDGGGSWSIRGVILQEQNLVAGFASSPGEPSRPFNLHGIIPTDIQTWLANNNLSSLKDLDQDLNGDGVTLLMAYALNLDANQTNANKIPEPQLNNGVLSLTYYALRPDINYQIETSADLQNWSIPSGVTYSAPDANGLVTASVTIPPGGSIFIQLVVTQK